MNLADEKSHRVLKYVAAIQQRGHELTFEELSKFASRPRRRAATKVVPYGTALQETLALAAGGRKQTAEGCVAWLVKIGWLEIEGGRENLAPDTPVVITPVGRIALAALEEEAVEPDSVTTVALNKGDPLAMARVIEQIGGIEDSALIDRFFNIDSLLPIVERTKVSRILMGPKYKQSVQQALTNVFIDRDFEVRVDTADSYHDRFVIGRDSVVWALGTSLNGVGNRNSIMTQITGPPARAVSADFEAAWPSATPLSRPIGEDSANRVEVASRNGAEVDTAVAQVRADLDDDDSASDNATSN